MSRKKPALLRLVLVSQESMNKLLEPSQEEVVQWPLELQIA
jgi:hypothetical protein